MVRENCFVCPGCGKRYMTQKRWEKYHKDKCPKKGERPALSKLEAWRQGRRKT